MRTITCPKCNTDILVAKRKKELEAQPAARADLHMLVTSVYDIQHMRLIFEGRFRATKDNRYGRFSDNLFSIEANMKDDIESQAKLYPISEWITAQKGLSYDLTGQLIGIIQDIKRFDNVSKLWAYFGLAVVDVCQNKGCGKRWYALEEKAKKVSHIKARQKEQEDKKVVKTRSEDIIPAESMVCNCEHPDVKRTSQRPIKGTLLDYNPTAKMLAFKVASQFVKQGDLYRKLYEEFKAGYEGRTDLRVEVDKKKGKMTKGKGGTVVETKGTAHIHAMAQRKMVKVFLQHLWVQWRTMEGLSISMPYVIDRLKHSDYIQPR